MPQGALARSAAFAFLGLALATTFAGEAVAAVGRTDADFGVTQNGAPAYTIPIRATEGINGLTPRLSINYVGPGSRSILGVGFALSGISYITPCRKTIAQDLNAAPVTLTSADRYCLDGARLRLINSQATYGATNTQYRTELDQLVRVTSLASTSNIPGWFKVEMPNGLTYEYGNSTDSKLLSSALSGATPQFWAISKILDRNGNSIVFHYTKDDSLRLFRPNYIEYTKRGSTAHYKISFVYQATLLPFKYQRFTPSMQGGAAHEDDRLLERIELKHDDVVYLAYKLTYQAGAGENDWLSNVQECAYAPSENCLPATVFTWQSATAGHDALASTSKAVAAGVLPLDINGDGIDDLVWAASGTWRYMLGAAAGFGAIQNTGKTATNPTKAMVLEWNGDGFEDLLIDWSDGKWRVLRGGASGFNSTLVHAGPGGIASTASGHTATVGDLNADGLDDLLTVQLNAALAIKVRFNGTGGFGALTTVFSDPYIHTKASNPWIPRDGASGVRAPDFNGDGRVDLLVFGCIWEPEPPGWCITDRWFQLMSNGTTFVNEGPITGAAFYIYVRFGDLNADGLTDIVFPSTTGTWKVGFGQGSGGFTLATGPSTTGHTTYQSLTGDYDGDGYDDLYVTKTSSSQWIVFRGTGTGLSTTAITPSPAISTAGSGWMLVDQDGDSLPDLGRFDTSGLTWKVASHKGLPGERLKTATDGLANKVTFNYLPMTDSAVYTKGSGAIYPQRDFEGSVPLVNSINFNPAGAGQYTLTYKYANARIHSQGRSFLGMGQRQITDGRNGVFTVETYRQDFPYIGAPATVTVKQSVSGSAKTIQNVTHTYFHHVLASSAGNQRYLPYRNGTVTKLYEVGGIKNGNLITEIIEGADVNTLGNTTELTVLVDDEDAGSPEFGSRWSSVTTATYSEDQTNWCIGLPLTRDETRQLPDGSQETRTLDWQVDTAECRVTQETIQQGGGTLVSLITDFGYDICGNVYSISSEPASTTNQERITTINYGSRCQRPATITNPEGHVTSFVYDWPLALPNTQTDPNGLVTDFDFDGFGRLTRILRPDGTGTRFALTACTSGNGWCGKTSAARVKVTRTERSTTDSVLRTDEQFLDGIGQARWAHSASLESGPAIVETIYDTLGRPTERSAPFFAGGLAYSTQYLYDLIGRVTNIDAPISEAAPSGRISGFKYEGRDLEVTDPKGFTTTRRSNALGQLRAVTDPSPGGITNHAYHPFGEPKSITDAAGNVTSWSINVRGLVTSTSDPDSGSWAFDVNAFGETTKIRDAKTIAPAWTTQFTFDRLSRPLTRIEAEGTTTFTWGTASHNTALNKYIGRLKSVSSPGGYSETYTFDQYARLSKLRTTIDGSNWDFDQSYWTATGLPAVRTYPVSGSGFRLRVVNNYQNNVLRSVQEYLAGGGGTVYWEAASTDAWGQVQDETFGNGVTTFTDFDQASGFMDTREAWFGATPLINANVDWDLNGNLTKRQDLQQNPTLTEDVVYDNLNRFASSTLNGGGNASVTLDAIGNITAKDGLTYLYTGTQTGCSYYAHTQPRAVRKIGSTVYCYDKNGNMTKRGGSTISYTSYNLPSNINSGSNSSTLYYGAFRNRYKQIAVSGGTSEESIYAAGLFERITPSGDPVEYRHYIPGGNGIAAIHTRINSVGTTYYVHADHLGSPELFTNGSGGKVVELSFAAYGARRNPDSWTGPPPAGDLTKIADTTRLGFTSHEHLDSVGLIHMNGRVYDPAAGRFLEADPILHLDISQSLNTYSYVWNNPLTLTDPTGFDVVINCIDACGGFPWPGEPLYPEPYDPPAGYPIDNPTVDFNWVVSKNWDGQSASNAPVIYGVPSAVNTETRPTISEFLNQTRAHISELEASLAQSKDLLARLAADRTAQKQRASQRLARALEVIADVLTVADCALGGCTGEGIIPALAIRKTASNVAAREAPQVLRDVVLRGGRGGQNVKNLVGPPNSVVRGSGERAFVTNDKGQVVLDITRGRVKPVTPGEGFGPKRPPTPDELQLLERVLGGGP